MNTLFKNKLVILEDFLKEQPFSLSQTFECGQCFRFKQIEENHYQGIVKNTLISVKSENQDLVFENLNQEQFQKIIYPYFNLDQDYTQIQALLRKNPVLRKAIDFAPGIRVLSQDPWETVCTFLFSQNNHIKRIAGIIDRFCECFGEKLADDLYGFPSPEKVNSLNLSDLDPIRAGFRAKYILDAAKKISEGSVSLTELPSLSLENAQTSLQQIQGIGPKVADCILLFSCRHFEAFPKDVWINRAMDALFPKGLPRYLNPYAGIAQQYLFHYIRYSPDCINLRKK